MPRLPDLDSLGARPVPVSRRGIASNPRAGAVGNALAGFGDKALQTGARQLGQAREKEDRLAFAAAKTAVLKADVLARQELETDPDFEGWEAKYAERMKSARETASGMIRSNADRSLFDADVEVDILRGGAALASVANTRRRDARVALLDDAIATAQDVAQSAPDEPSRQAALANVGDLLNGAVEAGDLTAEEAGKRRRGFTEDYGVQRIETLLTAGDLPGAKALFDASRNMFGSATEIQLGGRIADALEGREVLTLAEEIVHNSSLPAPPEGAVRATGWAGVATTVAERLGLDPVQVAAVMSFESAGTFDPTIMGGDGRNYMGLIQFGPEERGTYGIDKNSTPEQWTAAILGFMRDRGFKPGMGLQDFYSTILAGRPGRYDATDSNGTSVRNAIPRILAEHTRRAEEWLKSGGAIVNEDPQQHDLSNIYDNINERATAEGWTPERTEAVKAQAARLVQRDEALLERQYNTAGDEAARAIAALPNGLTDIAQIPKAIRDRMDPTDVAELQRGIRENERAAREDARQAAQEKRAAELEYIKRFLPGEYLEIDPLVEVGRLAPDQYNDFLMDWTEAKQGKPTPLKDIRAGIRNEIAFQQRTNGLEYEKDDLVSLSVGMEAQLGLIRERKISERKGEITAADYADAYRAMVKQLPGSGGWFGRDKKVYEALEVPAAEAERIRKDWTGKTPPTDAQILQTWMELRGGR